MYNILVVMAGEGKRFTTHPDPRFQTTPKPFIKTRGKTILERTTQSFAGIIHHSGWYVIKPNTYKLYFAMRTEHVSKYKHILTAKYGSDIVIIPFEKTTRGNLETAYISTKQMNQDWPLFVLDSDNQYTIPSQPSPPTQAAVYYFEPLDDSTKWAFITLKENGYVRDIVEKPTTIPHDGKALVGTFYFQSTQLFREVAGPILDTWYDGDYPPPPREYYMSEAIEYMLDQSDIHTGDVVGAVKVENVVPLGTPEDIYKFEHLRLVFDMDGTICKTRTPNQTYVEVEPIKGMPEYLQKLKAEGHYIIIQTARHMGTCASNEGKVVKMGARLLMDWLDKYNVPYDEVYFGKPHADLFIDDKGITFKDVDNLKEDIDFFQETRP
jgi:capsule biosynthesis phosphatase